MRIPACMGLIVTAVGLGTNYLVIGPVLLPNANIFAVTGYYHIIS